MKTNKHISRLAAFLLLLGVGIAVFLIYRHQHGGNRQLRVIMIQKAIDEKNDFWTSMQKGSRSAAKEYNIDLKIWGPESEREVDKAHKLIEEAIAEKPDAIVITPISYETTLPYARKIEEAGIPLIILDSCMAESAGVSFVATDNVEAGYKMGEYMRRFVNEDSVIGVVGHIKDSSTAQEREKGFRQGLGEYQDQIAEVVYCNSSFELAYELTAELLEKYPNMNVIAGLNEYSAVGAARAVVDLGKEDEVALIGFDSSREEVQLLERGIFEAIVIQKPFNMGYLGIEQAVRAARGETVESVIDSGSVLVTKETIYTQENQKILFPF